MFYFLRGKYKKMNLLEKIKKIEPKIEKELEEKGFFLYKWITLNQLRKTFTIDYLDIISKVLYIF
jgi:hypothetical protein